ncbi:MAG: serine/threonine-protein kinase [Oscillospiraceae bacterium]
MLFYSALSVESMGICMLENGTIIDGKYKILNKIGQGGMSCVYLAMNEKANKQWAIKEIRRDGTQNYEIVKQGLVVETDMLKRLSHPNLPSIIDVIEGEDSFLIVMDYIEGKPLSKYLDTYGAQSQNDVIEWAKQLCSVLGYLHSQTPPIVHRDMKPANAMLKPDGRVMLIDFGAAREFKTGNVADTTCLGTRGYAAPEQYGGQGQTDARTDIYCLGASLYHLITGNNPANPPYEMRPIRQWNPAFSSGLEEIILKCTRTDPNERYQSCAELMYALENYQELDYDKQKIRTKKWKSYIMVVTATLVFAAAACGFKAAESSVTADTYASLIDQATKSTDTADSIELLTEAMKTDPGKADAYNALLNVYYNDNDGARSFSKEESTKLLNILNDNNGGSASFIEEFETETPDEYAEFAVKLGNAYYFGLPQDEENNEAAWVGKATTWFGSALETNSLSGDALDNAELMYNLSYNYSKLISGGMYNNEGEPSVDYKGFWSNLDALVHSAEDNTNLLKKANIVKFSGAVIAAHYGDFVKADITIDEQKKLAQRLKSIYNALEADANKDLYLNLSQLLTAADTNITQAQTALDHSNLTN